MTETSLSRHDFRYELIAETAANEVSESPLSLLRRVLRGRLLFVTILATSLAALGALVGYKSVPPTYRSTGLVRVEGALPAILYDSRENQVPPLFDAFVASQVTYLQSRSVLDAAAANPALAAAGWPAGADGVARLQKALTVQRGRGEQVISVGMSSSEPLLAQTAVNSVLQAYADLYIQPQGTGVIEKEQALIAREQKLTEELQTLREQMLESSDQYGAEAISRMHETKVEELMAVDQKIAQLQIARANLDDPAGRDAEMVRPFDSTVQRLKTTETELLAEVQSLRSKYGENHPMIRELNRQIEAIRIQRTVYSGALDDLKVTPAQSTVDPEVLAAASRARLEDLDRRFHAMREQIRDDAAKLGAQRVALAALKERVDEVSDRLAETRSRLDELRVEANRDGPSRIRIASFGDLPVSPVTDRRRGLAGAGALFGGASAVAIVFFLGIIDPRVRYAQELEAVDAQSSVIGLIPDLSEDTETSQQRAGRGIHQLRNLLELQVDDAQENVHAVTSCDRGEGKSSVALALANSFAGAGRKTLLIDADISHSTLSRELRLEDVPGLREAIGSAQQNAEVHGTFQKDLWMMPIGASCGLDPADLSRHRLEWLLEALRSRFEAIVIDTGAIVSSVEACLVCAVADRTVLVVSRNQKIAGVRASVERLRQVGARCAGFVLNHAPESDFASIEKDITHAAPIMMRLVNATGRDADHDHVLPLVPPAQAPSDHATSTKRAA